ncbi:hypothetical protein L873DRAFT_1843515 [Choiromyces venosus 120613-1]|uniref:Uncharacterized protein n=1 Tax=Choiromyces venosus 120613-1 TaxID=1336337 RepID=A0A3N4JMY5_9PEZI|nr:hypothetical protein L873DRAFT_1843515 [Choiromyces venosus 120613-1]
MPFTAQAVTPLLVKNAMQAIGLSPSPSAGQTTSLELSKYGLLTALTSAVNGAETTSDLLDTAAKVLRAASAGTSVAEGVVDLAASATAPVLAAPAKAASSLASVASRVSGAARNVSRYSVVLSRATNLVDASVSAATAPLRVGATVADFGASFAGPLMNTVVPGSGLLAATPGLSLRAASAAITVPTAIATSAIRGSLIITDLAAQSVDISASLTEGALDLNALALAALPVAASAGFTLPRVVIRSARLGLNSAATTSSAASAVLGLLPDAVDRVAHRDLTRSRRAIIGTALKLLPPADPGLFPPTS